MAFGVVHADSRTTSPDRNRWVGHPIIKLQFSQYPSAQVSAIYDAIYDDNILYETSLSVLVLIISMSTNRTSAQPSI